jgi:glycosyltransferase involved in cell wall biosynthesis
VLRAYEAMVEARVDVVHDHTLAGPVHARSLPALRVVTTIHGSLDAELADVYRRVADQAAVVAISHNQREAAPDIDVTAVIHHGLDAREFPLGTGTGGYCLFLGRMSPGKGAHRAIRVAERAGTPLVLVGKMRAPREVEYFRSEVEPHLGDRTWYLGEVPHRRKIELLEKAYCLLFPIRWREPFGMVMLEALACGTPVLAFGEGAVNEVVEHGRTGFVCHDEDDMANALPAVDRLDPARCRAAVEGYFSAHRMVADHVELFQKLL